MTRSNIRLPAVLGIGFRGGLVLRDQAACRARLHAFLSDLKSDDQRDLFGTCELATPADLLFAELCAELNIPLRVLLATARRDLQHFNPADMPRVKKILASALSIEKVGDTEIPAEASYECGIDIVLRGSVLLVLADIPETDPGLINSVADILSFARELQRPVFCWNGSGETSAEPDKNWLSRLDRDPEMLFLARLPDEGVTLPSASPDALARAWFEKLDCNANRLAPQVLGLAYLPIILTAAAALTSGAAARSADRGLLLTAGTLLGVAAAMLPAVLRLAQRQALWARTRFAAEVCRSILSHWDAPPQFQAFPPEMIPELAGMLRALDLLRAISCARENSSVEQFKDRYREDRIVSQIGYFAKNSGRSVRESLRFKRIGLTAIVSAIALSASSFVAGRLLHRPASPLQEQWLPLTVSALFQISTVARALRVVNDCERRQRRYGEIGELLTRWEREFKALKTWPPVLRTVARIERALLVELLEWRSLMQNVKMPRN